MGGEFDVPESAVVNVVNVSRGSTFDAISNVPKGEDAPDDVAGDVAVIITITVDVTTTTSSLGVVKDTGGGTPVKVDDDATVVNTLGVVELATPVNVPEIVATKAPRATRSRKFWHIAI